MRRGDFAESIRRMEYEILISSERQRDKAEREEGKK